MRLRRQLLWLLPAVALLLPAGWALRWAWADIQYWQGHLRMERWADGAEVTDADWQRAHQGLERAVALNPGNGEYLSAMARLWRWKADVAGWFTIDGLQAHAEARDWHVQAIAARPDWPYEYVLYADVLRRLLQFDEAFADAVVAGDTLGPWEPGVQLMLADLLVGHADRLDPTLRERMLAAAGRGVRHYNLPHRARVVRLLRDSPWLDEACLLPEVEASERHHPYCERVYARADAADG